MTRKQLALTTLVVGLLGVLVALSLLSPATQQTHAAVLTPVYGFYQSYDAVPVSFMDQTAFTIDAYSSGIQLYTAEYCNAQWIADQTALAIPPSVLPILNTTTLTLQWSADDTNWATGPVLLAANVADGTNIVQFPILGRYTRIKTDVSNTNTVTYTVKAVCK